jgi:hypothetical protein
MLPAINPSAAYQPSGRPAWWWFCQQCQRFIRPLDDQEAAVMSQAVQQQQQQDQTKRKKRQRGLRV